MRVHHSITPHRIKDACIRRETTFSRPGLCVTCGTEHDDCEPDDMNIICGTCGEPGVYGSDELALRIMFKVVI